MSPHLASWARRGRSTATCCTAKIFRLVSALHACGGEAMTSGIEVIQSIEALRRTITQARRDGHRIGYVPTMGGLHQGHAALVEKGLERANFVGASIFVNPKQFDNSDEVATYPAGFEDDLALLEAAGARFVFAPEQDEIYPQGFDTSVTVDDLAAPLCGAHRPGHFDGVSTVVTKLLMQCMPDVAVFGEKDFQQLRIIQKLVQDLDIPVEILPCPTVRETDGLACSSRNRYLTEAERALAPMLNPKLVEAREALIRREPAASVSRNVIAQLTDAGFGSVEYFELRAEDDLRLLTAPGAPARLFAAAWLGEARLIDNLPV